MARGLPRVAAMIGGASFVAFGTWAFADPRSFYESVALWPPYNVHFLHDIGAFQIGLGAALLLALWKADSLLVALASVGLGQTVHAIAHAIDRDLGGRPGDPVVMGLLAVLLVAAAVARLRSAEPGPYPG